MEKIGEGGEAEVFALDGDRVLRLWHSDHPSIDLRVDLSREIAAGASHLDFVVPEILDVGIDRDGRRFFVERRLPGRSMSERLADPDLRGRARSALIDSYMDTAAQIRSITFERPWFGEVIATDPIRTTSWPEYLATTLARQIGQVGAPGDVEVLDRFAQPLTEISAWAASAPDTDPALVHFDYFPGNVLCVGSTITAVIDWSVLTIVGDPDLDLALAASYLGVVDAVTDDDHADAARSLAERGIADRAEDLARWGAAWWLPIPDDGRIRPWVASVLSRPAAAG